MNFKEIFELVLGHEGNLTKDPADKGNWTGGEVGVGELRGTKFGISAAAYPKLVIEALTIDDARAIYWRDYWQRMQLDQLPEGLRYFLFDYAVNSGVDLVSERLQGALGVLRDGVIGPKTVMAMRATSPITIFRLMFVERCMTFALSSNDRRYGRGWFARCFDVTIRTHLALNPALQATQKERT